MIIIKTYQTAQVAKIIGVHPNTVRLYEEWGLIPKPERAENGYRVFSDLHIEIFKLARIAFQIPVIQNGLRKKIINMLKTAATGDYDKAISIIDDYSRQIQHEKENAKEAINITKQILAGNSTAKAVKLKRSETAKLLQISTDTLRNWEMNGLLTVKRMDNGYRVYTGEDIDRLKVIRSLRFANYSLESILHMLSTLSINPEADIEQALDIPSPENDIIYVCDQLLTSLGLAQKNAEIMCNMLYEIKNKF